MKKTVFNPNTYSANKIKSLFAGAALVAGSFSGSLVYAQNANNTHSDNTHRPSYNYLGLRYLSQNLDDFDCNQDGLVLDASITLTDGFYVTGDYTDVSGDKGCGSSTLKAGMGYRHPWGDYWHMYGVVSFADSDYDVGGGDSGPVAAAGLRGYLRQGLEGYVELEHSTLGDGDLTASLGGAYHFTRAFALTGDVGFSGDQNSLALGARYHF